MISRNASKRIVVKGPGWLGRPPKPVVHGGGAQEMMKAIVYIAPDMTANQAYTQDRVAYAARRGYYLLPTVCRSWGVAHGLLLAGWAQVIILAHGEHGAYRAEVASGK